MLIVKLAIILSFLLFFSDHVILSLIDQNKYGPGENASTSFQHWK